MKKETVFKHCLLLLTAALTFAETSFLQFGGTAGFPVVQQEGVAVKPGPANSWQLVLSDQVRLEGDDLVLGMEQPSLADSADGWPYSLEGSQIQRSVFQAARGSASLGFSSAASRLKITPRMGAMFYPGSQWYDFSMEFWLYPASTQEGQKVFAWTGGSRAGGRLQTQEIAVLFSQERLEWRFSNVFTPTDGSDSVLSIKGMQHILPNRWSHHQLRYDSNSGTLEYLVNGRIEAVTYVTSAAGARAGRDNGRPRLVVLGKDLPAVMELGGFTGLLDEFRISRNRQGAGNRRFIPEGGFVELQPQLLADEGATIRMVTARMETPPQSEIAIYLKMARFAADLGAAEWQRVMPGKDLGLAFRGQIVAIRVELFPDGVGLRSPVLLSLGLEYDRTPPPSPPAVLTATPGNASVTLKWSAVPNRAVKGYRIYYGTEPGVYTSSQAVEGPSPVDAGLVTTFTLSGLKNGVMYFFAVSSYDEHSVPLRAVFSREVYARPMRQ